MRRSQKLSQSQAQGWERHWLGLKVATKLRHLSEMNFINHYCSLLSLISVWETKHQFKVVTLWILKAKVGGFNKAKVQVEVLSSSTAVKITAIFMNTFIERVLSHWLGPRTIRQIHSPRDHWSPPLQPLSARCTLLKHTILYYLSSYHSSSNRYLVVAIFPDIKKN